MQLRKEIAVEDSLKVIRLERMTKTEDGNFILLWDEYDLYQKIDRYDDGDIYSIATSFVCFDPNTLGLVSSVTTSAKKENIKVYPNPTSSTLNIYCDYCAESLLEILDLSGKLVIQTKLLSATENNIDVSILESGMYFYKIHSQNKTSVVGKWIKI
jgi:hypothetical protein